MNCRDFFDSIRDDPDYCKKLQNQSESDQVAWESEIASEHSTEPVRNCETLVRQVIDPTHYDTVSGNIAPTFFDDASSKGASCHRTSYTTTEKIKKMAEDRVTLANQNPPKTGPRKAIGFTTLSAEEVRSIVLESAGRRGVGVYDTAKVDDVSHADICQLISGRKEGKSVRAQLFMLVRDRLEFFEH